MTKKELILSAFNNKPVERVPVGFWFHYAKDELEDVFANHTLLALNIAGHKKFYADFAPDFVKIMTDGFFIYPNKPFIHAETVADLWNTQSIGEHHEWIEKQVAFAKTITDFLHDEVLSFYNIFAPATFFRFARTQRKGKTLADFIVEDKDAVIHALDVVAKDVATLARRVISEGGADGIYYSTQDLNDSRITEALRVAALEASDRVVLDAANTVSAHNILHICGYEGHRNNLAHFATYPAQAINWAASVEGISLAEGKRLFHGKAVIGGFDNTVNGVLYRGSKAAIEAETERLISETGATGLILGADCTVPRDIALAHLCFVRDKAR
jgi:uroporphyrinogen decarboxylase